MPNDILSERDRQELDQLLGGVSTSPRNLSPADLLSLSLASQERDLSQGMKFEAPKAPQMTTLDLVGLLGLTPLMLGGGKSAARPASAGMVRQGGRIGPARMQKLYDVMRNKELFPDVRFDPETTREATKIGKIGQGIEGPTYRVGKMALKELSSQDPYEAEAAYRLRDQPGFKHFLGTVAEARKDLPEPSRYSEIIDYISKGIVKPEDVKMLGLFTRFEPGLERFRHGSPQVPNIDLLREVVAAAQKAGVFPTDVHLGNVQYKSSPKIGGLLEPFLTDLGLSNLAATKSQKAAWPHAWDYVLESKPQGHLPGVTNESMLLDRIISHLASIGALNKSTTEAAKKALIKGKLSKGGE